MDKLIVLNCDEKQPGGNYKCITPQFKIAPHSQVCLNCLKFKLKDADIIQNNIILVNIPNLPISSPNCSPQKFGLLQTIGTLCLPVHSFENDNPPPQYEEIQGNFLYHITPEKWVNLDNQEELNLTELHVLITNHLGVPLVPDDNKTSIVIKFRQDPNFVTQSNMKLQQNMLRDLLFEQRTTVLKEQNIEI